MTRAASMLNSRGPEVRALQVALERLGFGIPRDESEGERFGPGTAAAVGGLQTRYRLVPTGVVDEVTEAAVTNAVMAAAQSPTRVEGRIVLEHGAPADSVPVRLYDRRFGGGVAPMAEGTTDAQGFYSLPYPAPDGAANVEVRAIAPTGEELALSATRFSAEAQEVVNLVAPASVRPLASEFDRMASDLEAGVGGMEQLAEALEGAERRDLSLLHQATGWDARLLALASTAIKVSATIGVPSAALYGLYRAGLPTNPQLLARVSGATVSAALRAVGGAGVVGLSRTEIAAARTSFEQFARAARREEVAPGARDSLGELLARTGLTGAEQETFETVLADHRGNGDELWRAAADQGLSGSQIDGLRLQGKLAYLTVNNAELAGRLQEEIGAPDATARLVDQGLHRTGAWKERIEAISPDEAALQRAIPPAYEGETTADRLDAYAGDLARKVRLSFPSRVVANMVETDELRLRERHAELKAPVAAFLGTAVGLGFELGRVPVDAFVRDHRDALFAPATPPGDLDATVDAVKLLARLFQITPTDQALKDAMGLGIDSAAHVVATPYDKWIDRYGGAFESLEVATQVYAKSQLVSAVSYGVFGAANLLGAGSAMHALSPESEERRKQAKAAVAQHYPTLEALLGSLDFCECEHCRSVLSPAAYLVDLLQLLNPEKLVWDGFLADWKAKHSGESYTGPKHNYLKPFDALVERRGDLPHLELTCENTNTTLPYIDLVLEILEWDAAKPNQALGETSVHNAGDATSAELAAEPQHIMRAAYDALEQAAFPLGLPFDLWLETVRGFVAHFDTPLWRLLDMFRPGEALFAPQSSTAAYHRDAVFAEYLGLSPAEHRLLGDPAPETAWHKLYGYGTAADAFAALTSARALSRRLGVTYKELVALVKTGFINPRLDALVILRKLGIETEDVFRYKGYVGYAAFTPGERAAFEQRLGALTAAHPGFNAATWLDGAWQDGAFGEILVLVDPGAGAGFDTTLLRYADGAAADAAAYVRLNLFVRLWRRLGWTIEETDRALQALIPRNARPLDATLGPALRTALVYLAHLTEVDERVDAGKASRLKLLTLWSDLPTTGAKPLYAQLFLTPSVLRQDAVFDDALGAYLSPASIRAVVGSRSYSASLEGVAPADKIDPAAFTGGPRALRVSVSYNAARRMQELTYDGVLTDAAKAQLLALSPSPALPPLLDAVQEKAADFKRVKAHLLGVQEALNLTAPEVAAILADAGGDLDTAELSLAIVSTLYRYKLLARALGLTVADFIVLKQLSGLDPFRPLHGDVLPTLAQDHPLGQTLAFVELAQLVTASGFTPASLDWLLRHRGGSGAPGAPAELSALVRTLAAGIRQIRAEHAVPADPSTFGDDALRRELALVLAPAAVDTFVSMLSGTIEYEAVAAGVDAADRLDPSAFAADAGIRASHDPVRRQQRLAFRGVLLGPRAAQLKAAHPSPLLATLLDDVQAQARAFFDAELAGLLAAGDYNPLFAPIPAGLTDVEKQERLQAKRARLAGAFLPYVQLRLIRRLGVDTVAAQLQADPARIEALITDSALLSERDAPGTPLLDAFAGAAELGVSATFLASQDGSGAALEARVVPAPDASRAPAGTNSARFEGYLEVPAAGAYRFHVVLERQGAEATLRFGDRPDPVVRARAAAAGAEASAALELSPGVAYRFSLDAARLGGAGVRLLVEAERIPKGSLERLILSPRAAADRVLDAQTQLAKALAVVDGVALSELELRHLATHASDFDGFDLSTLPTRAADDTPAQTTARFAWFRRLLTYAALRRELGADGDALAEVFAYARRSHPADADASAAKDTLLADLCERIGRLTGHETAVIEAVVKRLGFELSATVKAGALIAEAAELAHEAGVRRLWEALVVVDRLGVPVQSIAGWTGVVTGTLQQRFAIARELKSTVKAKAGADAWQRIARPIFDSLRRRQRDVLVAHLTHRHGYASPDLLFERYLIDPAMEPVVLTSRLQLAIASVQSFIQRCLLNLERTVHPTAINARHWQWMERYRLWEANRQIFLFPEKFLEPEFRDDKSHLFVELEAALLEGDLSDEVAEQAFLHYLRGLESLARLEIVSAYAEQAPNDPASNVLHVIGRTYALPHQYFYRRYAHRSWTPWEPVGVEIEGDHLAAVVWRRRLHLFWVTFLDKAKTGAAATAKPSELLETSVGTSLSPEVQLQLNWSEYVGGEWSKRASSGFTDAVSLGTALDRSKLFIHVTHEHPADAVLVHLGAPISRAFRVASHTSEPTVRGAGPAPEMPYSRSGVRAGRYEGSGPLKVTFIARRETGRKGGPLEKDVTLDILRKGGDFTLLMPGNPFTSPTPELGPLVSPFFYADERTTLFAEPTLIERTIEEWNEWVITPVALDPGTDRRYWEKIPLVAEVPVARKAPTPVPEPLALYARQRATDWVTDPGTLLWFGDHLVGREGGLAVEADGGLAAVSGLAEGDGHRALPLAAHLDRDLVVVGPGGLNPAMLDKLTAPQRVTVVHP